MPIIQRPAEPPRREATKISLDGEIFNEITAYCQWANITMDHFIEQAALIVFKKDKGWKEYSKKQQSDSNAYG